MAFNPFHSFRKHQKVIMVVVTVMIMFIFVLSYGGKGDIFDQLASLFGAGRASRQQPVTTLYGKKVTEAELSDLALQRRLVNVFMRVAIEEGQKTRIRELQKKVAALPDQKRFHLEDSLRLVDTLANPPRNLLDERVRQQYQAAMQSLGDGLDFRLQLLKSAANSGSDDEAKMAWQIAAMMLQRAWLINFQNNDFFYFGNGIRTNDLLDFLVWKQQADKLGINLTDADFRAEVNRQTMSSETLQGDTQKDAERIAQYLTAARYGEKPITLTDRVLAGLRDEIRVNMAQSALLGHHQGVLGDLALRFGVNSIPAPATPDQLFDYFRENCAGLGRVSLLPIPVKNFTGQVTDTPSDKELRALFREFRDKEPNPDVDTPGFKQPQRIRIEWVSARPDAEHFQKAAQEATDLMLKLAILLPHNPIPATALTGQFLDRYVRSENPMMGIDESLKNQHRQAPFTQANFALPYYTRLHEAENVAAGVGQVLGSVGSRTSPLAVVLSYQSGAVARETRKLDDALALEARERVPRALGVALGGGSRLPLGPLGALLLYDQEERHLSPRALTRQIAQRAQKQVAEAVVRDRLTKVRDELERLKKEKKEPKEMAAEVAKLVKEHNLKHVQIDKLQDRLSLNDDPSIKQLKESLKDYMIEGIRIQQLRTGVRNRSPEEEYRKLKMADIFFQPGAGLYDTSAEPLGTDERFLYWKIEEDPAKTFSTYDEAPADIKEAVKQAWILRRAREKARKVRDEVVATAAKRNNYVDAVRYLRDEGKKREWGEVFDLTDVAPQVAPKSVLPRPDQPKTYEPYKIPSDKEDLISPKPDFAEQLVKELKKSGDATWTVNKAETIYYVAVLDWREEERMVEREFVDLYTKSSSSLGDMFGMSQPGSRLLQQFEREQWRKYLQGVTAQLRAEAGEVNDQGEWKVDPELRKRLDNVDRNSRDD